MGAELWFKLETFLLYNATTNPKANVVTIRALYVIYTFIGLVV